MIADTSTLPLIDAAFLFLHRGCEAVADEPMADGTVPVNGVWRMEVKEWNLYRAECAADAAFKRKLAHQIEMEGCES